MPVWGEVGHTIDSCISARLIIIYDEQRDNLFGYPITDDSQVIGSLLQVLSQQIGPLAQEHKILQIVLLNSTSAFQFVRTNQILLGHAAT